MNLFNDILYFGVKLLFYGFNLVVWVLAIAVLIDYLKPTDYN